MWDDVEGFRKEGECGRRGENTRDAVPQRTSERRETEGESERGRRYDTLGALASGGWGRLVEPDLNPCETERRQTREK